MPEFTDSSANKYLSEVGHTYNFIRKLSKTEDWPAAEYSKFFDKKYQNLFNTLVSEIISTTGEIKLPKNILYASIVFNFVEDLSLSGKDPFINSKRHRILPLAVISILYRTEFKKLKDFVYASGFIIEKNTVDKMGWASISSRKFQNFMQIGRLKLRLPRIDVYDKNYSAEFYLKLDGMGRIGSSLKKQKKAIFTVSYTTVIAKIYIHNKIQYFELEYRLNLAGQFTFDNIKNPRKWLETYVVNSNQL